jgi:hypothetical protein
MSEKHKGSIEVFESHPIEHERSIEAHDHEAEKARAETRQSEDLEAARREIIKESSEKDKVLDKISAEHSQEAKEHEIESRRPVNSDLKQATFNKEIRHIRRKLSSSDRLGSKFIHQPIVKNLSEISSKTITRPSGLLGGGIVAFLGTSTYLYLTKHMGLRYNYSIFLFLLIAGFILGLIIEAVIRMARGRRVA